MNLGTNCSADYPPEAGRSAHNLTRTSPLRRVGRTSWQKMAPPKSPKADFCWRGMVGAFQFSTRSLCHMSSSFMVFSAVRALHACFALMPGNRSKATTFKSKRSEVVYCLVAHLHMHLVLPCTPPYPCIQRNFRVGIDECLLLQSPESRRLCKKKHVFILAKSLVGGLVAIFYFPIYWEQSSQLTFICFRGVAQPPTSVESGLFAGQITVFIISRMKNSCGLGSEGGRSRSRGHVPWTGRCWCH